MTIADERIAQELARLSEEHAPPSAWEDRVLAATADRPRRRWWWLAAPAVSLTAAILLLWVFASPGGSPGQRLALDLRSERTGEAKRGSAALVSAGDVAHATVKGEGPFRALWIYRDDRLVLACPGDPRCRSSGTEIALAVTLEHLGLYKLVALMSNRPIPPPPSSYDRAIAAARGAGVELDERSLDAR